MNSYIAKTFEVMVVLGLVLLACLLAVGIAGLVSATWPVLPIIAAAVAGFGLLAVLIAAPLWLCDRIKASKAREVVGDG